MIPRPRTAWLSNRSKTIQKPPCSTRTGVMKLTIDLPDRVNASIDKRYALEALVATLYWNAKLSGREARDILGVSRRAFEEILPQYGLSILVGSPDNIDTELA